MKNKTLYMINSVVNIYQTLVIKLFFFILNVSYTKKNDTSHIKQALYIVTHDYSHIDILTIHHEFLRKKFIHHNFVVLANDTLETTLIEKIMLAKLSNWKLIYKGSAIRKAIQAVNNGDSLILFVSNIKRNKTKMGIYSILQKINMPDIPIIFTKITSDNPSLIPYNKDIKKILSNSRNATYQIEYLPPIKSTQFKSEKACNRTIFKTLYNEDIT